MPPILWIIALIGTLVLVWLAHRSNQKNGHDYDRYGEPQSELGELEAEIYRLRHVVVEQAVDSYVMLNVDSEQWRVPSKRVTRYKAPAATRTAPRARRT